MIKIGKPILYTEKEKAYLAADILIARDSALRYREITKTLKNCPWRTEKDYPPKSWENGGAKLYFEVDKKYKNCLTLERSDSFVIAFLWYAILIGEDICFETPMSEKLFQGLSENLIPKLAKDGRREILLKGPVTSEKLPCMGAVGTGMSCGIDSFYTLRTHKLTHLTYYEGGHIFHLSNISDANAPIDEYYRKAFEIADKKAEAAADIAKESNLEFIYVKSNLDKDFYRGGIIYRGMYVNLACTMALQKLFKTYISSSSGHGSDLKIGLIQPTQNYENLLCDNCKTETLDYLSSDFERRFTKIENLSNDKLAAKRLDPCFNFKGKNCGECYGCLKTIVVLDLLGKLDLFDKVFDLGKYYADRRKHIKILADGACAEKIPSVKESWFDIVKYAKKHKSELSDIILEFDNYHDS